MEGKLQLFTNGNCWWKGDEGSSHLKFNQSYFHWTKQLILWPFDQIWIFSNMLQCGSSLCFPLSFLPCKLVNIAIMLRVSDIFLIFFIRWHLISTNQNFLETTIGIGKIYKESSPSLTSMSHSICHGIVASLPLIPYINILDHYTTSK